MQKPNESTVNVKKYAFIFVRLKLCNETITIDPDEAHIAHEEVGLNFRYYSGTQVVVCLTDGTYKVFTTLAQWEEFNEKAS